MKENEKISLSELQHVIRDKLYEALPGFYWVIAEIAELKVNSSGHCYLELTGSEIPGGKITARARATIWSNKFRTLNAYFISTTGIPLSPGITILFKATVDYHELYGLSLNIADIDPVYTAGEMALKREAIIRRLTKEGVMDMNRELTLPLYPRNIAVVSSLQAAGYQDFINHLNNNAYGYVFVLHLYEAIMQGEGTEDSVIEALDRISLSDVKYDAVVMIRGGGSTTDLSWFDNYNIAFHITQFPLPVVTGIGHEKDLSVADMVAWKALKTPTAVADYLITRSLEAENYVMKMATSIATAAGNIISDNDERLASLQNHIAGSARIIVRVKKEQVGYFYETLKRATNNALQNATELTAKLTNTLRHLNPESILRRGFTVTTREGKIVHSSLELSEGDIILTHFEKGKVRSIVNKESNKNR